MEKHELLEIIVELNKELQELKEQKKLAWTSEEWFEIRELAVRIINLEYLYRGRTWEDYNAK